MTARKPAALWNGSPRVPERKQLVMSWVEPGGVNVGEIRVSRTQARIRKATSLAIVDLCDK